jgi:hypothetical protein
MDNGIDEWREGAAAVVSLLDQVKAALRSVNEPSVALATLRNTAPLASVLQLIQQDRSSLAELASCSYRHRNGFDKIVLASAGRAGLKLVLHVWPRQALPAEDHVHNHRWDFSSVVLAGFLQVDIYGPDHAGAPYSIMRYRSLPGPGNCELEPDGTMTVSVHASVTMAVGSSYTWSADMLHRAYGVPDQMTATLIVQGPALHSETSVLVPVQRAGGERPGVQPVRRLDTDQLRRILAALVPEQVQRAWESVPSAVVPS